MHQPYPTGGQNQMPERPPLPRSVQMAVNFMYAGAALSLIELIVGLATAGSLRTAIHNASPDLTPAQLHTAEVAGVATIVVLGLIGIALWLWMAWANRGGRNWARIVATVLFGLNTLALLNVIALAILSVIAVTGATGSHSVLAISAGSILLPIGLVGLLMVAPAVLARLDRSRSVPLRRAIDWLASQTARARRGLTVLRRPGRTAHATAAQLTAWGLQLGVCYTTLLAVNLHPRAPVAAAAAVLVAVNVTAIIPVTPSNIAVFQAACIAVLAGFGVNAEQALAYGLVLQGVEIAVALSMGGPSLIREGLAWHHARPRPDPAPAPSVSAG